MEGGGHEGRIKPESIRWDSHAASLRLHRSPCRLAWPVPCACSALHAARQRRRSVDATSHSKACVVVPSGSERASTCCSLAQAPPLAHPPRPTTSPGPALRTSAPPGQQVPHNTSCNMVRNPCSWTGRREGEGRANTAATAAAVQGHALTRSLPWCFVLFFFVLFCFLGAPRQWLLFQTCALEKTSFTKKQRECAHRLAFEMELRPQAANSSREWWRWPVCYDVFFFLSLLADVFLFHTQNNSPAAFVPTARRSAPVRSPRSRSRRSARRSTSSTRMAPAPLTPRS